MQFLLLYTHTIKCFIVRSILTITGGESLFVQVIIKPLTIPLASDMVMLSHRNVILVAVMMILLKL